MRGGGREGRRKGKKSSGEEGATNDIDIDIDHCCFDRHSDTLVLRPSPLVPLSLHLLTEQRETAYPSRLAFTRKRDPHALQRMGLSGGPFRQQQDTAVPQWRQGPPSLATAGPLVVGSPPRI